MINLQKGMEQSKQFVSENNFLTVKSDYVKEDIHNDIKCLFSQYHTIISALHEEPFFSVKEYLIFILNYFVFAMGIYFYVPISIINFIQRIYIKITKREVKFVGVFFIEKVKSTFATLKNGEISGLKIITFRFITRLLILNHIKKRIDYVSAYVQYIEFLSWIDGESEEDNNIKLLKRASESLGKFNTALKRNFSLSFIFLFTPFVTAVSSVSKILGIDLPKYLINSFFDAEHFGKNMSFEFKEYESKYYLLVSYFSFVSFFLIWALVSCFIRMRELMLINSTYSLENKILKDFKLGKPYEIPFDIIGFMLGLLIYMLPTLFLQFRVGQPLDYDYFEPLLITFLLLTSPLFYAMIRRMKLNNC